MAIDVGAAAINRADGAVGSATQFGLDNPANATGTIDTVEVWCVNATQNFKPASFYLSSGTTYITRDSEVIGNVTAGSKQTFTGLSINIETSDYIGAYSTQEYFGNTIERDLTGFLGIYYVSGDKTAPTTSASYTLAADDAISLYGTGTETPTGWATIAKVNSVGQAAILKVNGVAKASIKKISGVAV